MGRSSSRLWKRLAACELIDPRKDKSRDFSPETIVAQLVFSFCSGGVSLSDAGRLGKDKAFDKLLGMNRWAEETTIRDRGGGAGGGHQAVRLGQTSAVPAFLG